MDRLKETGWCDRFSAIFAQGKATNLCGFLFALLHINPLLKRGLIQKGKSFLVDRCFQGVREYSWLSTRNGHN